MGGRGAALAHAHRHRAHRCGLPPARLKSYSTSFKQQRTTYLCTLGHSASASSQLQTCLELRMSVCADTLAVSKHECDDIWC